MEEHSSFFSLDDEFDRLPDSLLLLIFNSISDVKSLIRCLTVSKRFNSLIPHSDSLFLKIDCVISPNSDHNNDSSLISVFKSIVKSFCDLISPSPVHTEPHYSPAQILRRFDRIHRLQIEFPSADLNLAKGAGVKWKAEFGSDLRNCAILLFRAIRGSDHDYCFCDSTDDSDFIGWLKEKVFVTISTLITASARHFAMKEIVEEHREMKRLILRDEEGEGVVEMEERGLQQWRNAAETAAEEWMRTRVPSAWVRMRHAPRLELRGGVWMEDATMVVVRPTKQDPAHKDDADVDRWEADVDREEANVALRAFEGVYREAVEALLSNGRRYQLEMNSF